MSTVVSVNRANQYQFRALFSEVRTVSLTTLDVASLNDGAGSSESVTVTGVALGDMVLGLSCSVSTAGITVTANITATDTIIIRFQNESGGTLDLASQTVKLLIGRPAANLFT